MRDQRVLVISHGYETIYERGFCNGLSAAGIPYLLISSDRTDKSTFHGDADFLNLRGSQDEKRSRLKKALNLLRYHLALMWYVACHRHRVIHVIGQIEPPLLTGIIQGLWFRVFGRIYVLTVHNLAPHDRETPKNKWLYRTAFRIADKLVAHTARTRDQLIGDLGISPDKVSVMEHGIEPLGSSGFKVPDDRHEGTLRVFFFGKVLRYKGIDLLLEALRNVDFDFELKIAGVSRDPVLTRELEHMIAEHPRASKIEWLNRFIDDEEIPDLFFNADVLVLPYRHIDQSGVLFQSLRFGVPVIASDVGAFRDYIGDDLGRIFRCGDVDALRNALVEFNRQRRQYCKASITRAARRYEWGETVKALDVVYMNEVA